MVREENGTYIVKDSTTGGYVGQATGHYQQEWVSVWDKQFQLTQLHVNQYDVTEILKAKDKEHRDYHKAVRTKNRHLKVLKDFLGIEYKKPQEKKEEDLIYRERNRFSKLDRLEALKGIIHKKIVLANDGWTRYKIDDIYVTRKTPEKVALAEEYNAKLEQFMVYQKEMLDKIFSD
ncbi:hypothetical protein PP175_26160 (plasmid) [Aneurinibacillus sp. Ricciae_BoGa-3]|uniref:hypothetical protein n=1 Tax=Aneurinibacillus sp. Ricciae_BoGa-3 TaxID=3022697 RepID=UPI0023428607|nr:hypothetical protein [Aneurinibacillus sp. Ricciae_BoGa-3]WCK57552.1 hypothetical protein PP175_26160 [Aneurinibacillus sp. Ricciae_BoGa-3]